MNPSVPFVRVHVLPVLIVLVFGLVVLLPLPAHAAEQRLMGNVVVGPNAVEQYVSTVVGDVEIRGIVDKSVHSGFGDVLVGAGGKARGGIDAGFGHVKIEGPVAGSVHAEFGDVYVNAPVKGNVDVGKGDVDLGPNAVIYGNLKCESGEITGNRAAVKGHIIAKGMTFDLDGAEVPDILGYVGWFLAALAFAACTVLAAVIAPRPLAAAARRAEESPGRSFVYGLVSLPAFFLLCVVLAVTIVGIPLLLLLAPAYLALLFCGALVAAFFLGSRVLMVTGRYRVGNAPAAVVGAVILAATTLIPVLGDLLLYALSLLGTGAVILAVFSRRPRPTHHSYEDYVRDRSGG